MKNIKSTLLFFCICSLWACQKLPPLEKRARLKYTHYEILKDSLKFGFESPYPAPVSVYLSSAYEPLDRLVKPLSPIILHPDSAKKEFAILHQVADTSLLRGKLSAHTRWGNPYVVKELTDTLSWPFPKGKKYKILQAYHGSFSHNKKTSKYALDFNTQIGDTICATNDGIVFEVIQGYNVGGQHEKYFPYANLVTLYHTDGYLTQYVHLKQNSVFVKAGDKVKRGQAIALSGNTGFSGGPHLHFNVWKPLEGDIISAPAIFEKSDGADIKKGQIVSH